MAPAIARPFDCVALAQGNFCELSLELAHFPRAGAERDRHLSRYAAVGTGADHRARALRVDHCAGHRLDHRRAAHAAVEDRELGELLLHRVLPQHAASGAVVPVVLRAARTAAALRWALDEADVQRAVL